MRAVLVTNYAPDRQESMLRFSAVLAAELPKHGIEVQVLAPRAIFGGGRPTHAGLGKWLAYVDKYLLFPWTLAARARQAGPETLFHVTDHSNAVYLRWLAGRPHLLTCNDLLAIRAARGEFPSIRTGWSGRQLQRAILDGIRRAQDATCISSATRRDVLRLAGLPPERVTVTHMGFNHPYRRIDLTTARTLIAALLPEPVRSGVISGATRFVFHVGGNQWYKNRLGVLALYEQLRRAAANPAQVPLLLLAGQKPDAEVAARIARSAELREGVCVLEAVGNAQLEALYSAAECLFFPSLAEGFGWPIVEAQACGCRVVSTDDVPMTEVGGEGPLYLALDEVRPENPEGIRRGAQRIAALLQEDDASAQQRVADGTRNIAHFTTEGMIAKYVALYREILARG